MNCTQCGVDLLESLIQDCSVMVTHSFEYNPDRKSLSVYNTETWFEDEWDCNFLCGNCKQPVTVEQADILFAMPVI